jgi:hypothetical protein
MSNSQGRQHPNPSVAGSAEAKPANKAKPHRKQKSDLPPSTIAALMKYIEGTKSTDAPWSIMDEKLLELDLMVEREVPGHDWKMTDVHDGVRQLLREHECCLSGPYDGYYLIDMRNRPPRWPYRVLVSMPAAEFLPAEREYSAWLDARSATFRIDSLPEFGFVQASMKDRTLAEAFVAAHGGSLLTNQEVGDLLYGGEPVKASFVRRSRRREACATSTATPAM